LDGAGNLRLHSSLLITGKAMSRVEFLAPLSDPVWALERVADPVFAQKVVGDGLSIDPTDGLLVALCDGEVVSLHAAGHAVTLRTAEGIELLMHVGIDTVTLKGEGFIPHVKPDDEVRAKAPLIHFDLDFLANHAKSLLNQIVITNSEQVVVRQYCDRH
jgi:multiphosphoryl transfer protein